MDPDEAREELLSLLAGDPSPFPLDRAALLLAADAQPGLDPAPFERQLDAYAARVAAAAGDDADPRRRLPALRRLLFEDEGFHGNRADYYDVRNSYLNQVLERKLGIPISLSLVVLGVGRRLGWPMHGVSFPNHFLVAYRGEEEMLAVDPFHGGLILGEEELVERWRWTTGTEPPAPRDMLTPATPRDILVRMQNNLRAVYLRDEQFAHAARKTEWIALIHPWQPAHLRHAGYLYLRAGEIREGVRCLEQFLAAAGDSPERNTVEEHLAQLRRNGS